MKHVLHSDLKTLVQSLFEKSGCSAHESERIAHYLIEANLTGHDSHGVIRVPLYLDYLTQDRVRPGQSIDIVFQTETFAMVDGNFGFGQVIGEQATRLGIQMAQDQSIVAIALRNSGHLGRIGDWPTMVTREGMISIHFVNTNGYGLLVAPFGGTERRLSANPIAAGIPVPDGPPIILDISTSALAEGKLKVAYNKGVDVPPNCIIDHQGNPTTDPRDFYSDPPGVLLPFGGHKGYGLGILAEMFAGMLTGNGCSNPTNNERLLNGMFTIIINPRKLPDQSEAQQEVTSYIDYLKSSARAPGFSEILVPGEPEERTRSQRLETGIPLDDTTWQSLVESALHAGMSREAIENMPLD